MAWCDRSCRDRRAEYRHNRGSLARPVAATKPPRLRIADCGMAIGGIVAGSAASFHGTTPDAAPEAERALRVLRDHGQQLCVVYVPSRSDANLAYVAGAPTSTGRLPAATIQPAPGALYTLAAGRGSLGVPRDRSEPVTRGTVCASRACTDLWEPWAGNRPGPSGRGFGRFRGLTSTPSILH